MDECLACLDDFPMRKRRERADGDTRSEAIVSGVGRFLFIAPFSIAHLLGRAGGIWLLFTFRQRLVFLPVLSYPYLRSLISFPFTRGVGISGMAWGDTPRLVGGVIWRPASRPVPSSRSAARSISLYRLAGGCGAPFLSARFPAIFRDCGQVVSLFVSFPVSSIPSRGASRIYSLRFACRLVLLVNSPASYCPVSPGGSSLSLPVLFVVPWCLVFAFHLAGVSLFRLARSSRQAVRVLSFRPGVSSRRLVWRGGFSVSRLILFCSRIISLVASHRHGDGRRLVLPLPRGSVPLSRCPVVESDWAMTVGGNGACRSTIRRNAPFYSARFPNQGGE